MFGFWNQYSLVTPLGIDTRDGNLLSCRLDRMGESGMRGILSPSASFKIFSVGTTLAAHQGGILHLLTLADVSLAVQRN
jgi:hypothetical protein